MNEASLINLDDYYQSGFVVLRGAIDTAICELAVEKIWAELARVHGIDSMDNSTWRIEDPRVLNQLRKIGALDETATSVVIDTIGTILGDQIWTLPRPWGGPLVTFPSSAPWAIPVDGWHIDYPARGNLASPFGVKMLGLLSDMQTGGGATLLVPGSHRLVQQLATESQDGDAGTSSEVRKALQSRGVDLRRDYYEFTGHRGDVLLFDPWLFHVPSQNIRSTPRMMVEQNIPSLSGLSIYKRG
ncbi:MAG: phytanoyl-CoA dioxygenase family protein [Pseudomonadota bacterium]